MEDSLELANYLPLSFKTQKEEEYIAFLLDAFETNYKECGRGGARTTFTHADGDVGAPGNADVLVGIIVMTAALFPVCVL